MNAILVFFWHGTAEAVLHYPYITLGDDPTADYPPNERHTILTLVHDNIIGNIWDDPASVEMVYVLFKVACFMAATWYLAKIGYFCKI